jgi:hypothetical protein
MILGYSQSMGRAELDRHRKRPISRFLAVSASVATRTLHAFSSRPLPSIRPLASGRAELRQSGGSLNVLQIVPIREPTQPQRRNRRSFSRTQWSGQTYRVGLSETSGLFGLWLHGVCNSGNRITTASGSRCGCGITCHGRFGRIHGGELSATLLYPRTNKVLSSQNGCHRGQKFAARI